MHFQNSREPASCCFEMLLCFAITQASRSANSRTCYINGLMFSPSAPAEKNCVLPDPRHITLQSLNQLPGRKATDHPYFSKYGLYAAYIWGKYGGNAAETGSIHTVARE